jgi:hypothetical protein
LLASIFGAHDLGVGLWLLGLAGLSVAVGGAGGIPGPVLRALTVKSTRCVGLRGSGHARYLGLVLHAVCFTAFPALSFGCRHSGPFGSSSALSLAILVISSALASRSGCEWAFWASECGYRQCRNSAPLWTCRGLGRRFSWDRTSAPWLRVLLAWWCGADAGWCCTRRILAPSGLWPIRDCGLRVLRSGGIWGPSLGGAWGLDVAGSFRGVGFSAGRWCGPCNLGA